MSPERSGVRSGSAALCVLCRRRPVDAAWRPFCSKRCKLQDLAQWADGSYRVPGVAVADPDDRSDDSDEGVH
jgi:endogenous inhibitor of DNA gyrase (YacG/DUF329 family)